MSEAALHELAPGVHVWLHEPGDADRPNAGVVVDDDGITVVDALLTPAQAAPLAEVLAAVGLPVRRLVLTSSHVQYVGGSKAFPLAAVYGTAQISAHLDQPPNIAGYQRLFPLHALDLEELTTRPVSHTVAQPAYLTATAIAVPASGELAENLVVQVPEAAVLFGGALCWFGVTPRCFDGDPAAWADALDTIVTYAPIIVPGHGPIGGEEELRDLQAYLRACVAADGDASRIPAGPWDAWPGREFDAVNVERAAMLARGDRSPPPSMLRMLGLL
jgi:cyclase